MKKASPIPTPAELEPANICVLRVLHAQAGALRGARDPEIIKEAKAWQALLGKLIRLAGATPGQHGG